jgi:hypothetical protein
MPRHVFCTYTGVQYLIVLFVRESLGPVRIMLPKIQSWSAMIVVRAWIRAVAHRHGRDCVSQFVVEVMIFYGWLPIDVRVPPKKSQIAG